MIKSDELKPDSKGCLAKAKDDEMLFILRAQDKTAPYSILEWIKLNLSNCSKEKLREAFECALSMTDHPNRKLAD